jgi:flagellar motor switch protein FliN
MGDPNEVINQSDIEQLLQQARAQAATAEGPKPNPAAASQTAGGDPHSGAAGLARSAAEPEDNALGQDDIDRLLSQAGAASAPPAKAQAAKAPAPRARSDSAIAPGDLESLLHRAEEALASLDNGAEQTPAGMAPFRFEDLAGASASSETATLELIRDVELDLKIELGRTQMYLEDVLKLRRGSVVTLDKLAGDPVDIFVNGRLIARGEVLVMNDNFCVRVAELVAGVKSH